MKSLAVFISLSSDKDLIFLRLRQASMGIKNDLQKKKEYSKCEKNTVKNPTLIKIPT